VLSFNDTALMSIDGSAISFLWYSHIHFSMYLNVSVVVLHFMKEALEIYSPKNKLCIIIVLIFGLSRDHFFFWGLPQTHTMGEYKVTLIFQYLNKLYIII
jgi:hypothetical protein